MVCFLFEWGGYYFVYSVNRSIIKTAVSEYLRKHNESGEQQELSFQLVNGKPSDINFEWVDEHEFRFRGEMYDVVETRVTGDSISVRCVKDEQENDLIRSFENIVARQGAEKPSKTNSHTLLEILNTPSLPVEKTDFYLEEFAQGYWPAAMHIILPHYSYDVLTPPPQAYRI